MYYKLPVKQRLELLSLYKKAYPNMSYQEVVKDYNNSYNDFHNHNRVGPVAEQEPESNVGITGMMKSKIATEDHYGNPAVRRMVSPNPKTGMTPEGLGTHYMASMGEYAVPLLQDKGKSYLEYNENPAPGPEDIKFNNEREARYFAEHYKEVAPMMKASDKFGDGGMRAVSTYPSNKEQNTKVSMPDDRRRYEQLIANKQAEENLNNMKTAINVAGLFFYPASVASATIDFNKGNYTDAAMNLIPFIGSASKANTARNMLNQASRNLLTRSFNAGIPSKIIRPVIKTTKNSITYGSNAANIKQGYDVFQELGIK